MASIRDVARLAKVSPATVSRVMNGTARVDEEKKQRVLAAIKETGFVPNELARALYKQSSRIIGVIVPDIENPFFSEIAKAVEEEAYDRGYRILFCNSNDDPEKEKQNIQMLTQMKADGIIIMTNCAATSKVLEDCPIPVVLVDRKIEGGTEIAFIEVDHYKGGCMAAEYLVECGCRNIVCLSGPLQYSSGQERYRGYHDICWRYGLKEQCVESMYNYESGLDAMKEALRRYPTLDGVVACNDVVAVSAYKVLTAAGYRVPEDVQIIGFDDNKLSRLLTPEITTVAQPIRRMGQKAAEIIANHVAGRDYQKENIFDVKLVPRDTTKQ